MKKGKFNLDKNLKFWRDELKMKEYEFDDDFCSVKMNSVELFKGHVIEMYSAMEELWKNNLEIILKYKIDLNDEKNDIGAFFDDIFDHCWNKESNTYRKADIEVSVWSLY